MKHSKNPINAKNQVENCKILITYHQRDKDPAIGIQNVKISDSKTCSMKGLCLSL
ncbi:hypothetical protein IC582_000742 [Cucumis melo]